MAVLVGGGSGGGREGGDQKEYVGRRNNFTLATSVITFFPTRAGGSSSISLNVGFNHAYIPPDHDVIFVDPTNWLCSTNISWNVAWWAQYGIIGVSVIVLAACAV